MFDLSQIYRDAIVILFGLVITATAGLIHCLHSQDQAPSLI
jgi:hypothetical protein